LKSPINYIGRKKIGTQQCDGKGDLQKGEVGKKEGGLKLDVGGWVGRKGKGREGRGGGGGRCMWHQVNKPRGREARLVVSFIQMKLKMNFFPTSAIVGVGSHGVEQSLIIDQNL
jgi:hypothetical protein